MTSPISAASSPVLLSGTRLVKRSVTLSGHRTSVSLEDAFWVALKRAAARRGQPLSALIAEIDQKRQGNLSSALRVFALEEAHRVDTPGVLRV